MTVCAVGCLVMDLVARVPRLPRPGETVLGETFDRFLGGKGFNQAIAAARYGVPVSMVGCVGDDDYGREFLAALDANGIDRRGVSVDPTIGTGVGLPVVEASGQNEIVVVPRANHRLAPEALPHDVIANAAVVLLQWELPLAVTAAAARIARAAGAVVVLNPAPAVGSLGDVVGLVDVLVANEEEAASLGPVEGIDVVVTLGERGALVRSAGQEVRLRAHAVPCVDTVGAGDAFCGVLAAALAEGATVVEAARAGNAAGACAVTRHGAEPSMPRRAEVEALLATS